MHSFRFGLLLVFGRGEGLVRKRGNSSAMLSEVLRSATGIPSAAKVAIEQTSHENCK